MPLHRSSAATAVAEEVRGMARMIHSVAGSEDSGPRVQLVDGAGRVRRDEE
jgi:hypothetical protein